MGIFRGQIAVLPEPDKFAPFRDNCPIQRSLVVWRSQGHQRRYYSTTMVTKGIWILEIGDKYIYNGGYEQADTHTHTRKIFKYFIRVVTRCHKQIKRRRVVKRRAMAILQRNKQVHVYPAVRVPVFLSTFQKWPSSNIFYNVENYSGKQCNTFTEKSKTLSPRPILNVCSNFNPPMRDPS